MPGAEAAKRAGVVDVSDFGEKDISGAYPPGTRFDLGDGTHIEPEKVPDLIGKRPSQAPSKRPAK